ncbi:MAG TPA: TfoX/Sxy family protein [Candidatus Limnocylindrales bacterium]|nr:TfoX/Sxy family protein [Candidatus Limnocylindrales bacterium]
MDFSKAPPELVDRFGACLPEDPAVKRRPMFGWPSATVGGHMFASLFRDAVVVRLPPDAVPGGLPFQPMPGRTMTGYVVLPQDAAIDTVALRGWLDLAFRAAAELPPKTNG